MRKLATIRRIAEISPIEGADAIECVTVDGWKVVTKKGEFKEGDLCVYFEIDSVLPIREEFEFLRKGCYVKKDWLVSETNPTGEGFRLKTIRLRGQISQGLIVTIETLRSITENQEIKSIAWHEELDVTDWCGVVKWDPPVPATLSGRVRGNFPTFIPKTDQERIQNIKKRTLEQHKDHSFEVTMKLDGSSMTVYTYQDKRGVCSRNLDLDIENDPDTTFARVYAELGLEGILKVISTGWSEEVMNLAIQGELMGPGIQGNRENLKEHKFYVFDVYDIDNGVYYRPEDRRMLIDAIRDIQTLEGRTNLIEHCPVLEKDFVIDDMTTAQFLEMAEGPSINNPIREGLVFKCNEDPSFSFKAISNKFLLKGGE